MNNNFIDPANFLKESKRIDRLDNIKGIMAIGDHHFKNGTHLDCTTS